MLQGTFEATLAIAAILSAERQARVKAREGMSAEVSLRDTVQQKNPQDRMYGGTLETPFVSFGA